MRTTIIAVAIATSVAGCSTPMSAARYERVVEMPGLTASEIIQRTFDNTPPVLTRDVLGDTLQLGAELNCRSGPAVLPSFIPESSSNPYAHPGDITVQAKDGRMRVTGTGFPSQVFIDRDCVAPFNEFVDALVAGINNPSDW